MLILGIIMIILAVLALSISASEEPYFSTVSFISGCAVIFGIFVVIDTSSPEEPSAIDVYRGKTTLEITYRDSIPVDTVVVFKDE